MVFWNIHMCHQYITLQEIRYFINGILECTYVSPKHNITGNCCERHSYQKGVGVHANRPFRPGKKFRKSIFAKQCFYCICILNTGNLSDDQGRNYNCVQACLASLLVSWNHHPEYHYCLIIICAYCILHVQCHYQLELCQLNVCRLKGCNSEMEKHWDM